MHDVINIEHAKKAIEEGADGLILVCAGAGGHAGTLSPFALVREVRNFLMGQSHYREYFRRVVYPLGFGFGCRFCYMGTNLLQLQKQMLPWLHQTNDSR